MTKVKHSCPFIDTVQELLYKYTEKMEPEDVLEINRKLEMVREINSELREGNIIEVKEPYNFAAVIKQLKLKLPEHTKTINELIELYY